MTKIIINVGYYPKNLRLKDPKISELIEEQAINMLKEIKDKTGYVGYVLDDDDRAIYATVLDKDNK